MRSSCAMGFCYSRRLLLQYVTSSKVAFRLLYWYFVHFLHFPIQSQVQYSIGKYFYCSRTWEVLECDTTEALIDSVCKGVDDGVLFHLSSSSNLILKGVVVVVAVAVVVVVNKLCHSNMILLALGKNHCTKWSIALVIEAVLHMDGYRCVSDKILLGLHLPSGVP